MNFIEKAVLFCLLLPSTDVVKIWYNIYRKRTEKPVNQPYRRNDGDGMKKLLMLGVNNGSEEIIEYAKGQGIYTVVTDCFPEESSEIKLLADECWTISTSDVDSLENKCRQEKIDAVICGISEYNQDRVIELCERMDLPCYCTEYSWRFSRDKAAFKEVCRETGVPVPEDFYLTDDPSERELEQVRLPVMVKPVDLCSNRGISYCYEKEEVANAYRYARSLSGSSNIIVEKMLRGNDWLAFYALADGEAELIALYTSYSQTGEPGNCYFVNVTSALENERYMREMDKRVKEALKRMDCREGVCWIQMILNEEDNRFYAIEMGYRLPGDMIFLPMHKVYGFDAVKWQVDFACGKKHSREEVRALANRTPKRIACSYMLWTKRDGTVAGIEGMDEIAELPCRLAGCAPGIGESVEKYRPFFTFVFDAENAEEICDIIRGINERICVKNTEGRDMLIYYSDFEAILGK